MNISRSKSKQQRRSVSRPKIDQNLLQNSQIYSVVLNKEQLGLNEFKVTKNVKRNSKNSALSNLKINSKNKKLDSLKQRQVNKVKPNTSQKSNNKIRQQKSQKRNASVKLRPINQRITQNKSIQELFEQEIRGASQRIKQRSQSITIQNLTLKQKIPIDVVFQKTKDNIQQNGKFLIGQLHGYYSSICSRGLIKDVNEDKLLCVLNKKINQDDQSIFAVFDGHSAETKKSKQICSEFLQQNFLKNYQKICKENTQFSSEKLLQLTLENLEEQFLQIALKNKNKTGSCANVLLIQKRNLICANVGDSKTIVVESNGKKVIELSTDHKPNSTLEKQRIIKNGGTVKKNNKGPYRVYLGGLAVSRALGNIHMKFDDNNKKINVLISDADVMKYQINTNTEFMIQSSDGIYQQLKPKEIVKIFVEEIQNQKKEKLSIQEKVDQVLKNSLKKILCQKLTDNLTVTFVLFKLDILRS